MLLSDVKDLKSVFSRVEMRLSGLGVSLVGRRGNPAIVCSPILFPFLSL